MSPEFVEELTGKKISKSLRLSLKCEYAETYPDFVAAVNDVLDEASIMLRESSNLRYQRSDLEDGISSNVRQILVSHGLSARPTHVRGNADLLIEDCSNNSYSIICEAKILGGPNDYSNSHLFGGIKQLCTRYDAGDPENDFSVFLIYNYKGDNKGRLAKWVEHFFKEHEEEDFPCLAECTYIGSAASRRVFTAHINSDTGEQSYVRHLAIPLKFDPKDR